MTREQIRGAAAGPKASTRLRADGVATARPPSIVRSLLRLPLYYKLITANAVITLAAVLTCAAVVSAAVRANASASTTRDMWLIVIIAALVGVIVNSLVVRIALQPVRHLEAAAVAVRAGDDTVRAQTSAWSDAATADVVTVFNTMLDSLAGYRSRLREIAIRAMDAGEAERMRLSRELHDGVAQSLAAALVQIRVVRGSLPEEKATQLTAVSEQIAGAIDELRALARALRPPSLDMVGLSAALQSYVRGIRESASLRVELRATDIDNVLSNASELALYRLLQEALVNVVQHAHAPTAVVDVEHIGSDVVATVVDNGRGFDLDAALANGALGLYGMYERAMYVGGRVEIHTAPGKGTMVRVTLPVGEAING